MVGARITISGSLSREVDHAWDSEADEATSPHGMRTSRAGGGIRWPGV